MTRRVLLIAEQLLRTKAQHFAERHHRALIRWRIAWCGDSVRVLDASQLYADSGQPRLVSRLAGRLHPNSVRSIAWSHITMCCVVIGEPRTASDDEPVVAVLVSLRIDLLVPVLRCSCAGQSLSSPGGLDHSLGGSRPPDGLRTTSIVALVSGAEGRLPVCTCEWSVIGS